MNYEVSVNQLVAEFNVGFSEEERKVKQKLRISCDCQTTSYMCYAEIREIILSLRSKEWKLLEDLGESLIKLLLNDYSQMKAVKVKIEKFFFSDCESTAVTIESRR